MTPTGARPLRDVLEMHRDEWDRDATRPAAREAFAKVVDCGTEALGAEVFASDTEERVVYHTCKSRACPSCGYQATRAWQRDQWRELPDVPSSVRRYPESGAEQEQGRKRAGLTTSHAAWAVQSLVRHRARKPLPVESPRKTGPPRAAGAARAARRI